MSEVLAAQTRVDAPSAAAAAERRWRRHRAAPPPLSEEDIEILRKARASAAAAGSLPSAGVGYGASALVLPKLSLRPAVAAFGGLAPPPPVPPAAVVEAASRGLATGARAAAYGSALALAGVALGSLWAARWSMTTTTTTMTGDESESTSNDASLALKETLSPLGDAAREFLVPVASWARREIGGGDGEGGEAARTGGWKSEPSNGDFSAALGRRLDASKKRWASRAGISSD